MDEKEDGGMPIATGKGELTSGGAFTGIARDASDLKAVMALLDDPKLGETALIVNSSSATAVVPVLTRVRGIVCLSGGPTSHLALVARECSLPCVMGATIDADGPLDGRLLSVSDDGTISVS